MIDGKGPSLVLGHPVFFESGWLIDLKHRRLLEGDGSLLVTGEDKTKEDEVMFGNRIGKGSVINVKPPDAYRTGEEPVLSIQQ